MCHQTVGLVQAQLEEGGIVTASVTLMPEITRKIGPPRALAVAHPLGFAFGEAGDADSQREIVVALLRLCSTATVPVVECFDPES